jgi:hypothetical protein
MARPPKDPALRMSADLRIPVTATQKQLVADAMAALGAEFAGWARTLILDAAKDVLNERNAKKPSKRARPSRP